MTAGGRRLRFRAVVVVGDKKGRVGVASAKATDVSQAIEKATKLGKKNMINVQIVDDTIPHQSEARFEAAQVLLRPQGKGRIGCREPPSSYGACRNKEHIGQEYIPKY